MNMRKLVQADAERVEGGKRPPRSGELMEKLLKVRIEGPEDFSENFDAYLNGERRLADGEDPR